MPIPRAVRPDDERVKSPLKGNLSIGMRKGASPELAQTEKKESPPVDRASEGSLVLNRKQAAEYFEALEEVLRVIAEAEDAGEPPPTECARELSSGIFPNVLRLRDRLEVYVNNAAPGETFELTKGEATVASKAVDCAAEIGNSRISDGVIVGGAVVLSTVLYFLFW